MRILESHYGGHQYSALYFATLPAALKNAATASGDTGASSSNIFMTEAIAVAPGSHSQSVSTHSEF
ncbi:hypothetical protein [Rhizobium leguminosarum]|uniref:Uncharacterized protein n=1 Tax=Rhizobium leguminosarum TaxID=384 RepID=A0ABD7PWP6_RHILE|nr:hypothetical protein [Rhizobium leguminosarum]TAV91661.1 hypothetical protein ELI22_21565 [Rhizobium leguminosarum]TAV96268.1 hypothetical protein ELI21_21720 [Rhizobium leguminosarum]TAW31877.1 hypothetical protein ELI19_21210 [Rhizobium leguminosarum]TAW37347.1 hypothetical protein ELI23_21765 [Rhizobium leguminosarum]TAW45607.1 hypothetical protein ELI18_21175 [Rhizobium leguminosarum]